jgi:hypothetical protein
MELVIDANHFTDVQGRQVHNMNADFAALYTKNLAKHQCTLCQDHMQRIKFLKDLRMLVVHDKLCTCQQSVQSLYS